MGTQSSTTITILKLFIQAESSPFLILASKSEACEWVTHTGQWRGLPLEVFWVSACTQHFYTTECLNTSCS